jgi:ABC-type multidrug transport system fused ATPase/permease subunit
VAIVAIPLSMFFVKNIAEKAQKFFKKQRAILGELNSSIEEDYTGQLIIKASTHEAETLKEFKAKNDEVFDEEAEDDSEEELEEVEDAPKMTRKERRLAKKAAKAEKESLTMEDSQNPEVTSEDIEESEDDDFEEEGGFFSRLFRKEEDVFAEDDTTGTIFDDDMSIANPVKENPVKEDTKNDKEDRRDNGDFDIMDLNDL